MSAELQYMVCVKCMTFNHHAYIEDAMKGFCMQKTDFPYICIVMDDCSTDGEQEEIKRYYQENFDQCDTEETDDYVLNFGRHKINENCYFAVFYLKYNHYSIKKDKNPYYARWYDNCKYVAFCEGDDYWIDEKKLQMQVKFLETNLTYSACYSNVLVVDEENKNDNIAQKEYPLFPAHTIHISNTYYVGLISQTATLLARKCIVDKISKYDKKNVNGDVLLSITARAMGNIYFFSEIFAKYRRIYNNGSWSAITYKKDMSLYYFKSRIELFNYSSEIGKDYSNRDYYLANLIFSKISSTLVHPSKSNFSILCTMIKLCNFKIKLPLYFLRKCIAKLKKESFYTEKLKMRINTK